MAIFPIIGMYFLDIIFGRGVCLNYADALNRYLQVCGIESAPLACKVNAFKSQELEYSPAITCNSKKVKFSFKDKLVSIPLFRKLFMKEVKQSSKGVETKVLGVEKVKVEKTEKLAPPIVKDEKKTASSKPKTSMTKKTSTKKTGTSSKPKTTAKTSASKKTTTSKSSTNKSSTSKKGTKKTTGSKSSTKKNTAKKKSNTSKKRTNKKKKK